MLDVCHITSVHPRDDRRIFEKECLALVEAGYSVGIIVADGKGCSKTAVEYIDVGKPQNRLIRVLFFHIKILKTAMSTQAKVFHLHDPELVFVGYVLSFLRCRVIYDAHEDVITQIRYKRYLPSISKFGCIALLYCVFKLCLKRYAAIVAATPTIQRIFSSYCSKVVTVCNYPASTIQETFDIREVAHRYFNVIYIGNLSETRGILDLLSIAPTLQKNGIKITLAGRIDCLVTERALNKSVAKHRNVTFLGHISPEMIPSILDVADVGIVCLHPLVNYKVAYPVKLFEYMQAGLPVIASNFPIWRDIVENNGCGVCIEPQSPDLLVKTILSLKNDKQRLAIMSKNGKNAVKHYFNWEFEKAKLIDVYKQLTDGIQLNG